LIEADKECNQFKCSYASHEWRFRQTPEGTVKYYVKPAPKGLWPPASMGPKLPRRDKKDTPGKKSVRAMTFERDGHRCLRCGVTTNLSYDHVVPVSCGGPFTLENGQTLCKPCNEWKSAKTIDFRKPAVAGNE